MKEFSLLITFLFAILSHTTASMLKVNLTTSTKVEKPVAVTTESSFSTASRELVPCNYFRGLFVGGRERELECCKRAVKIYHANWLASRLTLNRFLETLKGWSCPQFQQECNERLFDFNPFTELLYDYICNKTTFFKKCLPKLKNMSKTLPQLNESIAIMNDSHQNNANDINNFTSNFTDMQWQGLLNVIIQPAQLTTEELLEPCVQVAQYAQSGRNETFQEVIDFGIPSCGISWCGFGAEAIRTHEISVATCIKSSCRTSVTAIAVFSGILGIVITVLNVLIILTLFHKREGQRPLMKSSQAVFKLSLAIADLLVGVIVLPICIVNLYAQVWTRHLPRDGLRNVEGFEMINGTLSEEATVVQLEFLAGSFDTKFPLGYVNFAGFFTAVTIFASVYMLAGAGFDRLKAVTNPFSYIKRSTYTAAIKACIVFWIIAIAFGLLPIFIRDLRYVFVFSFLFATLEFNGYILYAVSFFIPLIIVWIVNILTYYYSKKHANLQLSFTEAQLKKRHKIEQKHAKTLRIMVGVFTFNTLPLIITFFCPFFIPSILPNPIRRFNPTSSKVYLTVQFIATFLLLGNSLCNFFIYNARNREFRKTLKSLFSKFGKATKLSICFNRLTICSHDLAQKSSSVGVSLPTILDSSNSRNDTKRTPQDDVSNTHTAFLDNSTALTDVSQAITPNLNRQKPNHNNDAAINKSSDVPTICNSLTLETLKVDSTVVNHVKQTNIQGQTTNHSGDADHSRKETVNL